LKICLPPSFYRGVKFFQKTYEKFPKNQLKNEDIGHNLAADKPFGGLFSGAQTGNYNPGAPIHLYGSQLQDFYSF
jgi:hypothetical protein